jgi:hypothetical protein
VYVAETGGEGSYSLCHAGPYKWNL